MKFFRNQTTGEVLAYESDGSQDHLIYKPKIATREVIEEAPVNEEGHTIGLHVDDEEYETGEFTEELINPDLRALTDAEVQEHINPPPTLADIERSLLAAVDRHVDAEARSHGYDNRVTAAMRAGYPGPYQAEGQAFALWMDECYALCIEIKDAVLAGERPVPTEAELLAELPVMVWPA